MFWSASHGARHAGKRSGFPPILPPSIRSYKAIWRIASPLDCCTCRKLLVRPLNPNRPEPNGCAPIMSSATLEIVSSYLRTNFTACGDGVSSPFAPPHLMASGEFALANARLITDPNIEEDAAQRTTQQPLHGRMCGVPKLGMRPRVREAGLVSCPGPHATSAWPSVWHVPD